MHDDVTDPGTPWTKKFVLPYVTEVLGVNRNRVWAAVNNVSDQEILVFFSLFQPIEIGRNAFALKPHQVLEMSGLTLWCGSVYCRLLDPLSRTAHCSALVAEACGDSAAEAPKRPGFEGATYDAPLDKLRLNTLLARVFRFLRHAEGRFFTLSEIREGVGSGTEASISARLRDLRKEDCGSYTIARRRRGEGRRGVHEYGMVDGKGSWSPRAGRCCAHCECTCAPCLEWRGRWAKAR